MNSARSTPIRRNKIDNSSCYATIKLHTVKVKTRGTIFIFIFRFAIKTMVSFDA